MQRMRQTTTFKMSDNTVYQRDFENGSLTITPISNCAALLKLTLVTTCNKFGISEKKYVPQVFTYSYTDRKTTHRLMEFGQIESDTFRNDSGVVVTQKYNYIIGVTDNYDISYEEQDYNQGRVTIHKTRHLLSLKNLRAFDIIRNRSHRVLYTTNTYEQIPFKYEFVFEPGQTCELDNDLTSRSNEKIEFYIDYISGSIAKLRSYTPWINDDSHQLSDYTLRNSSDGRKSCFYSLKEEVPLCYTDEYEVQYAKGQTLLHITPQRGWDITYIHF